MPNPIGRVTYFIATSVDGKIAHDDGSFTGMIMEGDHVAAFEQRIAGYDAVVMGRKTYEIGLAAGLPLGQAAYPKLVNYVISTTLTFPADATAKLVSADPVSLVHERVRHGEDVWVCGGCEVASALLDAGVVDEVVVKVNPTIFGAGIPLARALHERIDLELTATQAYASGVVVLDYTCR